MVLNNYWRVEWCNLCLWFEPWNSFECQQTLVMGVGMRLMWENHTIMQPQMFTSELQLSFMTMNSNNLHRVWYMSVCVYYVVCTYVCMLVHVCVHVCVCVCACVHVCMYVYTLCVHVYVCVCTWTSINVYVIVCAFIWVHVLCLYRRMCVFYIVCM